MILHTTIRRSAGHSLFAVALLVASSTVFAQSNTSGTSDRSSSPTGASSNANNPTNSSAPRNAAGVPITGDRAPSGYSSSGGRQDGLGASGLPDSDSKRWEGANRVSKMLGADVRNTQGEKIGDIKDLIVDAKGNVSLAVISTGGFLGLGDRMHAVPWGALQRSNEKGERILDMDKNRLREAPGFDSRQWPNLNDERWMKENQRYYSK